MSPYTEKIGTLLYMGHLAPERAQALFATWPQKGPLYRFEHHHVPYLGFDRPGYHCTLLLMHDADEVVKLIKRDQEVEWRRLREANPQYPDWYIDQLMGRE